MPTAIDYRTVEIPDEKPRNDFSYTQRRAEILDVMREVGHPDRVRQAKLADQYGVNQSTISRDLTALAEYADDTLGDRRTFVSQLAFDRAIRGLLEEEEWRKVAQTVKDWNEWIDDHKALEELQERMDAYEEHQQRAKYG